MTSEPNGDHRMQDTEYEMACIDALRLRLQGQTYAEIAAAHSVSTSTAHARVDHAIEKQRPTADYDRYRARQLTEMEPARQRFYRTVTDPKAELVEVGYATDKLLRIHEREAKLLNLDAAPTPLELAARQLNDASDEEIMAELERKIGGLEDGE